MRHEPLAVHQRIWLRWLPLAGNTGIDAVGQHLTVESNITTDSSRTYKDDDTAVIQQFRETASGYELPTIMLTSKRKKQRVASDEFYSSANLKANARNSSRILPAVSRCRLCSCGQCSPHTCRLVSKLRRCAGKIHSSWMLPG